jgi:hypothetical protein
MFYRFIKHASTAHIPCSLVNNNIANILLFIYLLVNSRGICDPSQSIFSQTADNFVPNSLSVSYSKLILSG